MGRGLGGGVARGSPLTELHPVPLAERVHVAAQVVQYPGGQLVDVAGHGWAPEAGGQARRQLGQPRGDPGLLYSGGGRVPASQPATSSGEVGGPGAWHHRPQRPLAAPHRPAGWTDWRRGAGTRLRTHEDFSGSPRRTSDSSSSVLGAPPHRIHSTNILLITYYMPGTVQGIGDTGLEKIYKLPYFHGT